MKYKERLALAARLKKIALIILLVFNSLIFLFSLFSGSESFGGGFIGVVKNSPNALPWLVMFGIIYVAWKWERIGGTLITALGLLTILAFDTYEDPVVFFIISFPFIILGLMLLVSWYLKLGKKEEKVAAKKVVKKKKIVKKKTVKKVKKKSHEKYRQTPTQP